MSAQEVCDLLCGASSPAQSISALICRLEVSLHLMWETLLPDHDLALADAGIKLLDLPQEVLHAIFSHFKAHEWAQGPAQSCRLLSRMDLSRVALHLPVWI